MADEPKPEEKEKPAEQPAAAVPDKKTEDAKPAATKDESGRPTIAIKVFAPFKVYFEGEGYSLSAVNETGPFDVLPRHRNFLCMLVPCDLIIHTPHETQTIKISRALMHVKAEKVTVYLDV